MDLRAQSRISTPECFVCRWAGKHIIIWPQIPLRGGPMRMDTGWVLIPDSRRTMPRYQYTSGAWQAFVKVEETIFVQRTMRMRSKHMEIEVCGEHWFHLHINWIEIAQEEVALEERWHRYLERMEK